MNTPKGRLHWQRRATVRENAAYRYRTWRAIGSVPPLRVKEHKPLLAAIRAKYYTAEVQRIHNGLECWEWLDPRRRTCYKSKAAAEAACERFDDEG